MEIKNYSFKIEKDPFKNNSFYAVIRRKEDNFTSVVKGSTEAILLRKIEKEIIWQDKNNNLNKIIERKERKELKELAF